MSPTLIEALAQAQLEVGKTYHVEVNEKRFEVRALAPRPTPEAPAIPDSDITLEPWVILPEPEATFTLIAPLGEPDPPDIPSIPPDEEDI